MTFLLMATSVLGTLVCCYLENGGILKIEQAVVYADEASDVATESETTERTDVGEPGMVKVSGKDIKDGTYDIETESDSGMFNIVKTVITVKSGKITADITLHGDGYQKLYQGTGEEASKKKVSKDKGYKIVDGKYTYTIEIPALNAKVPVAALSEKYKKWYDHFLVFKADSLPADSVKVDLDANKLDRKDGEYTREVKLEGGTGRATITSPAKLTVKDGIGTATIEWSSPNYDYMIVAGEKYLPKFNDDGNSMFEIPVTEYDKPVPVKADTTAMSVPHEIEYKLTFDKSSINGTSGGILLYLGVAAAVIIVLAVIVIIKKRKGQK
jgi:uncharacterized protein with FMN-binding domain